MEFYQFFCIKGELFHTQANKANSMKVKNFYCFFFLFLSSICVFDNTANKMYNLRQLFLDVVVNSSAHTAARQGDII